MTNANLIQFTKPHESELISKLQNVGALIGIITNNQEMLSIFQYVGSIATSTQPILITGETGVGKELAARLIHKLSLNRGELVTVNVAGLDDNVFSDSLFGHAKGAFTGADKARRGLIEKAGGGILFLDEIGNLSRSSQVKLLRLLQEGEYRPIGQDELKHTDARIITATNMDLWSLQKSGHFRKDLNFRLRTHHINIPPLRERKDDIPLLLNHFVEKTAQELNKKKPTLPKELIPLLETYSFPGNIRELQAMVYDAISRHSSRTLSLDTFNKHIEGERKNITTYDETDANALVKFSTELPTIKHATQLLVNEALKRAKGNNTLASKMLGISRQALSKRLKNRSSVE